MNIAATALNLFLGSSQPCRPAGAVSSLASSLLGGTNVSQDPLAGIVGGLLGGASGSSNGLESLLGLAGSIAGILA